MPDNFRALPEGTVTILFTDTVGSTALNQRLGDDAAHALRQAITALCREQMETHRGVEVKGTGDGLMLAFQSARRGVRCAQDIQRAMATRSQAHPAETVQLRVGLHTGEVIHDEEDLFGETVVIASRLEQAAEPGSILASSALHAVLGTARDELEDRGERHLKGIDAPWRVYEVPWRDAAAGSRPVRAPLIGRDDMRQRLASMLESAAVGRGALAMISGEPGVGKTRLTEELEADARERGFLVLRGHCQDDNAATPYRPFTEMLARAFRVSSPDQFREILGEAAPEVAKFLPQVRQRYDDVPDPVQLPPDQERQYLLSQLGDVVERSAQVQPLVMIWEDLHWADSATLALLRHLAGGIAEQPILIAGTYRDTELSRSRPLADALHALIRSRAIEDFDLRRLAQSEVAAMLRAFGGSDPPPQLVDAIFHETEGLPLFVEEVFRHFAASGRLLDAGGAWLPAVELGEAEVPRSVQLVIGDRLSSVAPDRRDVLTAAAVVGRDFQYAILTAVVGDENLVFDALDEAELAHLVEVTDSRPELRYRFSHEMVRQTLLSELSSPRRQRLHLAVADVLEAANEKTAAPTLAHHLYEAGAFAAADRARRALMRAAEASLVLSDFEGALRAVTRAGEVDPSHADPHLHRLHGMALRSLGRWEEAHQQWQAALTGYEARGDTDAFVDLASTWAVELVYEVRIDEAVEIAERGLAAGGTRTAQLTAVVAATRATAAEQGCQECRQLMQEAEDLAEQVGDAGLLGEVRLLANMEAMRHGEYAQSAAFAEGAAILLDEARRPYQVADAKMFAIWANLCLGETARVRTLEAELLESASVGHHLAIWFARLAGSTSRFWDQLDVPAFESELPPPEEGRGFGLVIYLMRAMGRFYSGDWSAARVAAETALAHELPGAFLGAAVGPLMLLAAYEGDRSRVEPLIDRYGRLVYGAGERKTDGATVLHSALVEASALLGDTEVAARLYPATAAICHEMAVSWSSLGRLTETVAGVAAASADRWAEAEAHFERARVQAEAMPHRPEQADIRRWHAWMLLRRDQPGDRDHARQLLTESTDRYRIMGMPKHVEVAEQILAKT